jgi:hypothetical protein
VCVVAQRLHIERLDQAGFRSSGMDREEQTWQECERYDSAQSALLDITRLVE